jgi:protein O-GlcNAc transferase
MKLSPQTVALWARVLQAVPGSTLCSKRRHCRTPASRRAFRERFAAHGIAADRLDLRGPSGLAEMMQAYGEVDIALDPTPYNGGTTTFQALWMGVPVITLAGSNFVGRMGASFLSTLGEADWMAADEPATSPQPRGWRATVRTGVASGGHLRERLAASPLCDIATWVATWKSLYDRMWADW